MIDDILKKVGLSKGEISVYMALVNSGLSTVNDVHKKTGIERRNIYDILNKLIERGLITYVVENRKRVFRVSHPSAIAGYVKEKKDNLDEIEKDLNKELPTLIAKMSLKKQHINAEIFRGQGGIKAVWEDMLNYKELRWIGAGRYVPKKMPHYFTGWDKRRIKMKIPIFNLLRWELRQEITPFTFEHVKFLPKEFSGNPAVIGVYGNKVVDFLFGEEFFAFSIESEEIAANYRRYHRYLWDKVAKP